MYDTFAIDFELSVEHFFRKVLARTTFFVKASILEFGIQLGGTSKTGQHESVL